MHDILMTASTIALIAGAVLLVAAIVIFLKLRIWEVIADLSGKTARTSIEQIRNQNGKPVPRKQHASYVDNGGMNVNKRIYTPSPLGASTTNSMQSEETSVLRKQQQTEPISQTAFSAAQYGSEGTMPINAAPSAYASQGTMPINAAPPAYASQGTMPINAAPPAYPSQGTMPINAAPPVYASQGTMPINAAPPVYASQGTMPINAAPPAYASQGTMPIGSAPAPSDGTAVLNEGTAVLDSGTVVLDSGTIVLNAEAARPRQDEKQSFRIITDIVLIHTDESIALVN